MDPLNRIVVLVDMDCFYCQVEENLNPLLIGKPIAVVQYNAWRGGGIIAVNYPAKDKGVTRHMRGCEAKEKCPDIILVSVPTCREKADLTKYRDAGKRVAEVLQTFTKLLERASVDEAYLDITEAVNERLSQSNEITLKELPYTHVVGYETADFLHTFYNNEYFIENNLKLAMGGVIAEEIRTAVYERTGYKCSAGIAHNKILAKLACGLHKPNQQTILSQDAIPQLYKNLPVSKIRSLGGKFGISLTEDLGIETMGELEKYSEQELIKRYGEKNGIFLHNIARGVDLEPVTIRLVSKSIGCCKKFPGRQALINSDDVNHWINELTSELLERLEKDLEENNRRAKQMVIGFVQKIDKKDITTSRTHALHSYNQEKIAHDVSELIKKFCLRSDGTYHLKYLGVSATKFESCNKQQDISSYFQATNLKVQNVENSDELQHNLNESNTTYSDETISDICDDKLEFAESCSEVSDSFAKQAFSEHGIKIKKILNESESDSISGELKDADTSGTAKSYFSNFFRNLNSPSDRNFDTSRHLQDDDVANCEEIDKNELLENCVEESPRLLVTDDLDDTKETCGECKKTIPKSEMISHLDYHYALKMVRDEAHVYKGNKTSVQNKSKIKSKSVKRKKIEGNSPKLTAFMQVVIEDKDTPTEVCKDCNKRIKIEDVVSHTDFHVAKKLHMEINSVKACTIQIKKHKNDAKNKLQSVAAFFKPI